MGGGTLSGVRLWPSAIIIPPCQHLLKHSHACVVGHWRGRGGARPPQGTPSLPTMKPPRVCLLLGHEDILGPVPAPLRASGSSAGPSQAHPLSQTARGPFPSALSCFPSLYPGSRGPRVLPSLTLPNLSGMFVMLPTPFRHSALVRALFSTPVPHCPYRVSLLPQSPLACGLFTQRGKRRPFSLTHLTGFQIHCMRLEFL